MTHCDYTCIGVTFITCYNFKFVGRIPNSTVQPFICFLISHEFYTMETTHGHLKKNSIAFVPKKRRVLRGI